MAPNEVQGPNMAGASAVTLPNRKSDPFPPALLVPSVHSSESSSTRRGSPINPPLGAAATFLRRGSR